MKKNMKFVINTTYNERGGNIVLYLLGKMLEERGYDVSFFIINYTPVPAKGLRMVKYWLKWVVFSVKNLFRELSNQIFAKEIKHSPFNIIIKRIPFFKKNTVVIYPDIIYGNPLHAMKVVRWFLYHNRFPNDPDAYGKNELTFCYREHFNDYNLNPACRVLTLNYFDTSLYKQTNFGEREGVCYIIRKGKKRKDLPKVFDGPIIDDLPENEKVAVFNRCKYCYDYDTQTFYTNIACVCGCIPIVMMELGKTKSDYLGKGDFDYGKAYGDTPEEIEYAIKTRQKRLKMLDFSERNEKNVDFFLNEVEQHFGESLSKD